MEKNWNHIGLLKKRFNQGLTNNRTSCRVDTPLGGGGRKRSLEKQISRCGVVRFNTPTVHLPYPILVGRPLARISSNSRHADCGGCQGAEGVRIPSSGPSRYQAEIQQLGGKNDHFRGQGRCRYPVAGYPLPGQLAGLPTGIGVGYPTGSIRNGRGSRSVCTHVHGNGGTLPRCWTPLGGSERHHRQESHCPRNPHLMLLWTRSRAAMRTGSIKQGETMHAKYQPYRGCNCQWCRHAPSHIKGAHKRQAHRALRRETKDALRNLDVAWAVSTGPKV